MAVFKIRHTIKFPPEKIRTSVIDPELQAKYEAAVYQLNKIVNMSVDRLTDENGNFKEIIILSFSSENDWIEQNSVTSVHPDVIARNNKMDEEGFERITEVIGYVDE